MAGGLGGDEQPGGDLGVSVAGADQVECLPLTPGQAQPMGPRRDPRPAGTGRRPGWRIFCPVIRAAATAPRLAKIFTASRSRRFPALSCGATAASLGPTEPLPARQPPSCGQQAAAHPTQPSQRPDDLRRTRNAAEADIHPESAYA